MNTKSNHTEAPWKVVKGKKSDELFIESDTKKGGRLCRLWNGRTHRDGNANLIAAAPELLEALNLAHEFLNSLPEGWLGKTSGDIGALNDFYLTSRKALSKVNGEKCDT